MENVEEFIKDCKEDKLTRVEVCKKYNITRSKFESLLKELGVKWTKKPDPKTRYFTKEEIDYFELRYNEGVSLVSLGIEFGCCDTRIAKELHLRGVDTSKEKKHRDVLEIATKNKDEIIKLYTENKLSAYKIGDIFNMEAVTVYRYLHLWGINVADKNKRMDIEENKDKIIELFRENYHYSEIGEIFKCDRSTIYDYLKKWGVDLNRKLMGTSIENKIEKFLIRENIIYEKQYKLENRKFDFYIPASKILIEVHGDYWHGNPKKYEKLDDIQRFKKDIDRKKKKLAKFYGLRYIWIWEDDIMNDFEKVTTKLIKIIINEHF